jgi:hypothetical protein
MGPFKLEAGELVDLGVYGPFRPSDMKRRAVFFVKNFIHSHKCEEWAFGGESDNQVDITDDVTGDIHDQAKGHILAYVNENNDDDHVCVQAIHDAQGSVHYLLGHEHQCQGSFIMPSDNMEIEIFVNYSDGYEKVRVRKGYSFLPNGKKKNELLEELANDDVEYVKDMSESDSVDVESCVDFLSELVTKESFNLCGAVSRTLLVAAILQRRAKQILITQTEDDHGVNMRRVLECSSKLVSLLLTLSVDGKDNEIKRLQADGNFDKVLANLLRIHFSADDLSNFSEMMV